MQYAMHVGYSDVNPHEVIRTVSERCLEIREMNAERDPTWAPNFVPGGFSAHCTNNHDQRWIITSSPDARVQRIRLHKDGTWRNPHGARFYLDDKPRAFHDYNF